MDKNLHAKLLGVIKELYSKHAYSDISMSMILNEADISKGAFYWYFKSKDDAFSAAFEECYQEVVAAAHSFDRDGKNALQIIIERQKHLLALDMQNPVIFRVISNHLQHLHSIGESAYPYGDFKDDVSALVDQGIAEGTFQKFPREFIIHLVFLFNTDLCTFFEAHPEIYEDTTMRDQMIEGLYRALV